MLERPTSPRCKLISASKFRLLSPTFLTLGGTVCIEDGSGHSSAVGNRVPVLLCPGAKFGIAHWSASFSRTARPPRRTPLFPWCSRSNTGARRGHEGVAVGLRGRCGSHDQVDPIHGPQHPQCVLQRFTGINRDLHALVCLSVGGPGLFRVGQRRRFLAASLLAHHLPARDRCSPVPDDNLCGQLLCWIWRQCSSGRDAGQRGGDGHRREVIRDKYAVATDERTGRIHPRSASAARRSSESCSLSAVVARARANRPSSVSCVQSYV